jgi:hypothetical protein
MSIQPFADISVREQILQKIVSMITPVAEQFGAGVFRSPTVALQKDQVPAIVVFPEKEVAPEFKNNVSRTLIVRIVAVSRGDDATTAEVFVDRMMVGVYLALRQELNLGGLCQSIKEDEIEYEIEEADPVIATLPTRYAINFRTRVDDPTNPKT